MSLFGADVDGLRALSTAMAHAADQLQQVVTETSGRLNAARWIGPDAERFRSEWQGQSIARLTSASSALRAAATAVTRNAEEQQNASAAAGAGGFAGATPNPGNGSDSPRGFVPSLAGGFRDFTNASPYWPISNDTLLSSVPGIKDALPYADGAAVLFDDRLSPTDKLVEGSHLAYDDLAGSVRTKAAESGDLPAYLSGVAMSQWGDVVYEGAQADFSQSTRDEVVDYIRSNPGGAFDAAVGAVKDYLPKLLSNFSI